MGTITQDTFNPLRAYCNVRLQQGVPLVDADVNELDDIRKFELRAFLKWFVGDGVPAGNNGFQIAAAATPSAADFQILGGVTPVTTTTLPYVQPAIGASVTVTVAPAVWTLNQYVGIIQSDGTFAGLYQVTASTGPKSVTLTLQSPAGVPAGTTVTTAANVFASASTNLDMVLGSVGRLIVDGLDVIITLNTTYQTQYPLSSVDTSPPYSLPQVAPIPVVSGTVLAYLDIWERPVDASEDASLVVRPLGTESCARIKRQWRVRTRVGTNVPAQGDPDFIANHLYYPLASINRQLSAPNTPAPIQAGDIIDLRDLGLSLRQSNLIQDTLGETAFQYGQGQGRPAMSLRDAINSLARGEVPALPEQTVSPSGRIGGTKAGGITLDSSNGLVVTWVDTAHNAYAARLDLGNPSPGFSTTQIIGGVDFSQAFNPSVAALPGGDLIIVYSAGGGVFLKRGPTPAALATATPVQITTGTLNCFVVASGNNVVVFSEQSVVGWGYQRYNAAATSNPVLDAQPVSISGSGNASAVHAAVDGAGNVWVAFTPSSGVTTFRLNPVTGVPDPPTSFNSTTSNDYRNPFVLCVGSQVWVFWWGIDGIWYANYNGSAWSSATQLPYTVGGDNSPTATVDASGRIALVYGRSPSVVLSHGDPSNGGWFPPSLAVAVVPGSDNRNPEIIEAAGSLALIWTRHNPTNILYYRQICYPL